MQRVLNIVVFDRPTPDREPQLLPAQCFVAALLRRSRRGCRLVPLVRSESVPVPRALQPEAPPPKRTQSHGHARRRPDGHLLLERRRETPRLGRAVGPS